MIPISEVKIAGNQGNWIAAMRGELSKLI